jgi:hypothetical protein
MKGYLKVKEAAERAEYCEETIRRACRKDKIPCRKLFGQWHIPEDFFESPTNINLEEDN